MLLVDINLLPKKEPRNIATFIIIILSVIVLLAVGIYFYWQKTALKQALHKVDEEITVSTELLTLEQKKLTDTETMSEVEQLEKAITWTNKQPTNINYVVQQLVKLLPERGFFQSFNLSTDSVQTTIQFDTSEDAAYYLNMLLETEWISEANLTGRSTRQIVEQDDEADVTAEDDEIMPRYIANYTIELDLAAVKEITNESSDKGQAQTDGGDVRDD